MGLPVSSVAQYNNTTSQSVSKEQIRRHNRQRGTSKWFTGGMVGGGFSTNSSYFEVAPIIGYKATPKFYTGTRLTYIYQSYKSSYSGMRYNLHIYGGSLFARYILYKSLFAQTEYEILSVPVYPFEGSRRSVNSLFVGGGFMQQIGRTGFSTISILYNILDNEYSPYSNPLIRIGFGFGF